MIQWIKCSERLPEKDGVYLVYPQLDEWPGSWFSKGKFAISSLYNHKITHWMPLPEPPEAE